VQDPLGADPTTIHYYQDYTEKIVSYVEVENAGADCTVYKTATGNAGVDFMAYMTINDKNCNLSIVLTAMDKKTAKIR